MKKIKKMLKKVDDIVKNIDTEELLKKMELDEKEQQEYELQFDEIKVYYNNNNKYKTKNEVKYNKYKSYNDYDVEGNEWTSIKAS